MHDNSITLQEAIDGVIKCQHENGHPDSYIKNFRYTCNRLLRLADQLETFPFEGTTTALYEVPHSNNLLSYSYAILYCNSTFASSILTQSR